MSHRNRLKVSLLFIVAMTLVARTHSVIRAADAPFRIEPWGQLTPAIELVAGSWGDVPGMAVEKNGHILVVRRGEPPLVEFDPSGKILKTWGKGMFVAPHALHIDRDGNIWVSDLPYRPEDKANNGRGFQVFKFTPDGSKVLLRLGKAGIAGDGPDTFNQPAAVVTAPNGDIFVTDGHDGGVANDSHRVVKFSSDGTFIKAWGKKGSAPGEFSSPHAIAMDSRGRVFVADRGNKRIQIFDQDGKFLDQWTQLGTPSGLFITRDDVLYVADNTQGVVIASARDGSKKTVIAREDLLPESITVGADGVIYTGESGRHRSDRPMKMVIGPMPPASR